MTFPFLFGIMYGDIGHGFIITLVAALFIWKEKQIAAGNINEIIGMVFGGIFLLRVFHLAVAVSPANTYLRTVLATTP